MIGRVVEWEGEHAVLVRFGLRRPGLRTRLRPTSIVIGQSGYQVAPGLAGLEEFVQLELSPPTVAAHADGTPVRLLRGASSAPWRTGGGLGLAALTAHVVVPAAPELYRGKVVLYRTLDDLDEPTTPRAAAGSIRLTVLDLLASRHGEPGGRVAPEPAVWAAVVEIAEWLGQRYGVPVLGGFDVGQPFQPGDWAESAMRKSRGETHVHEPADQDGPATYTAHTAANERLRSLGFEPGDGLVWDTRSVGALTAYQTMAHLLPDGMLGPITASALRRSEPPR